MEIECYINIGTDKSTALYSTAGRIKVLAGSVISNRVMLSTFKQADKRRELIESHTKTINGKIVVQEDVEFATPSAAANFCTGRSSNGWINWKTKDGLTLAQIVKQIDEL